MPSHAEIFDDIYRSDAWSGGSGMGSREELTRDYRTFLQYFLNDNHIKSVVDLGCGDWQFSRHMDWTGIDYTGLDVSTLALERAQAFARPGIRFAQVNAVTDPLPAAEILIVKDVLQHWSNADIQAFLPQLRNYRGALITNGNTNRSSMAGRTARTIIGAARATRAMSGSSISPTRTICIRP
jgi:SAM-dependent methyltransferase